MAEKKGVEIDYCPECRGVWLDRGELEKIIDRSADHYSKRENYDSDYKQYGYGDQPSYRQSEHPHYRQQPYKKKKSFLDDFFDF